MIDNSSVSGDISGDDYIGGLIGYVSSYTTIKESNSVANLSGNSHMGGKGAELIGGVSSYYCSNDECYNIIN